MGRWRCWGKRKDTEKESDAGEEKEGCSEGLIRLAEMKKA